MEKTQRDLRQNSPGSGELSFGQGAFAVQIPGCPVLRARQLPQQQTTRQGVGICRAGSTAATSTAAALQSPSTNPQSQKRQPPCVIGTSLLLVLKPVFGVATKE